MQPKLAVSPLLFMSVLLAACVTAPPLDCTSDADCGVKLKGVCVASAGLPSACGLPDETCPSGYRYYKNSSGNRSNLCAVLPTFEITPSSFSVNEHDIFSAHVVAKDGNGQVLTTYAGKPTVSADWGDARVFSAGDFVSGAADYTLWLNRETNIKDGPEHIVFKDSASIGRSNGIQVKAKQWKSEVTSSAFSDGTTKLVTGFTLGKFPMGKYFLISTATPKDKPTSVHVSTSYSLFSTSSWDFEINPILHLEDIPGNTISTIPLSVACNASRCIMSYIAFSKEGAGSGLATTTDGKLWKSSSQLLSSLIVPGDEPCSQIGTVGTILFEPSENLRIYYFGGSGSYCTAESMDNGVTWLNAKQTKNLFSLNVAIEGTIYRSYIDKFYLTSKDGVDWTISTAEPNDNIGSVTWDENYSRFISVNSKGTDGAFEIYSRE